MEKVLRAKFESSEFLRTLLASTGAARLIEDTAPSGDRYWGAAGGLGENHLGRCLMRLRSSLRGELSWGGEVRHADILLNWEHGIDGSQGSSSPCVVFYSDGRMF